MDAITTNHRRNNFDFLRIVFALLVIFSHAYALTGANEPEPLFILSGGYLTASSISLGGFFSISGYLVYQSFERSSSYWDFIRKRVFRIFPALFVCLVILAFVVCPFFTEVSGYYYRKDVYMYVVQNMLLFKPHYHIADVFSKNPYNGFINGSIWTLAYEMLFYVSFFILFFFRNKMKGLLYLLPVFTIAAIYLRIVYFNSHKMIPFTTIELTEMFYFSVWFFMGMWMNKVRAYPFLNKVLCLSAWVTFITCMIITELGWLVIFYWPIILISLGARSTPYLSSVQSFGDPSYGIYIYAFPVQQILVYMGITKLIPHMLIAMTVSIVLGYLSWHLVEKHVLRLKSKTRTKQSNLLEIITDSAIG